MTDKRWFRRAEKKAINIRVRLNEEHPNNCGRPVAAWRHVDLTQ